MWGGGERRGLGKGGKTNLRVVDPVAGWCVERMVGAEGSGGGEEGVRREEGAEGSGAEGGEEFHAW